MEMAGCVDRLWILEQSAERRTLRAQLQVLGELRGLKFDASINFSDNDRNLFHAAFIGARHRLGLRGERWHFWSPWLIHEFSQRGSRDVPMYQQNRVFLKAAGFRIEGEPTFTLRIPREQKDWAAKEIPAGAIHLSINASSPYKEWSIENWAGLVGLLAARGTPLVATSSDSLRELGRLRELELAVPKGSLRLFPGGINIAQLAALIERCKLHVGADSGAIHLAMGLGIPTVGVYRDYDGRVEWTPAASPHALIIRPCRCLAGLQDDCRSAGTGLCLAAIKPSEVFAEGIERILGAGGMA